MLRNQWPQPRGRADIQSQSANTMSSNPMPQSCRWPFAPFWGIDGFDFTGLPRDDSLQRLGVALYGRSFTNSVPGPKQEVYSRRACNNVAVQFRAMLYCEEAYPGWVFWDRVHECSHKQGRKVAAKIGVTFVEARKAYLRSRNGCPNGAAESVDE
ncbi:hypothetical protein VTK56DRAFT_9728 [Thermocarpiscus australiensis]